MSSPGDYYKSLPIVSKAYGTICFVSTVAYQLQLLNLSYILMDYNLAFRHLQIWRCLTNYFFLGKFSINFGIRLMMIARYAVQLERGPFEGRTADFLWMVIFSMIALLVLGVFTQAYFMAPSLVFMFLYVWSREYASSQVNISGLFNVQGFYLPWIMLFLNAIFGSPLLPDLMGIIVGHMYYYFTVLHPRNGGRNLLGTPLWVHKLASKLSQLTGGRPQVNNRGPPPQANNRGQPPPPVATGSAVFRGRSYRLNG